MTRNSLFLSNIKLYLAEPFRFLNDIGGSEKDKLTWLIRLRWLAIVIFSILSVPAYIFDFLGRQSILIYIGSLAMLSVFNLLVQLSWLQPKMKPSPYFVCFQLAIDLFCLSTLLLISGGYENPFIPLFFFHAALGGLLISGNLSLIYLFLAHLLLAFIQMESLLANIAIPIVPQQQLINHFFADHLLLFIFWFALRSVGRYFEKQIQYQVSLQSRDHIQNEKRDRLKALGALAAGFSHEFASPLSTAKIRLSRMERQLQKITKKNTVVEFVFDEQAVHVLTSDLSQALSAVDQCEMILRQMNSSQLDIRSFQIQKVLLGEMLRNICQVWQDEHLLADLQIDISFDAEAQISSLNFAQVVLNLLDNAYEACPEGKISVTLGQVGDSCCLEILDAGTGFSNNILSRVGEPFVTEKSNGTGLGLYVTDLFMQSVSGSMRLKNTEKGACVSLLWPVVEAVHEA